MKSCDNTAVTRKFLKSRLLRDYHTFRGFENERTHVKDLLLRTVESGESNSALIVGPRGSGKTTVNRAQLRIIILYSPFPSFS